MIHKPVLLKEIIQKLKINKNAIVVDATLGGGSYSKVILNKIGPKGKLIAIDKDILAIDNFKKKIKKQRNVFLFQDSFSNLDKILASLTIKKVNNIVADLGVSSDQLESKERGFSYKYEDAPLDMRMNYSQKLTAEQVINSYTETQLKKIFWEYGNEYFSRNIAKNIVRTRQKKKIKTVGDLMLIIQKSIPQKNQQKNFRIHWATRTFQALRIEVNHELEDLKKFLEISIDRLKKGGRLGVVSFHSGEDKLVKKIFQENARGCICPENFPVCRCGHTSKVKIINSKPIVSSEKEVENNFRARSAKLRLVEKI